MLDNITHCLPWQESDYRRTFREFEEFTKTGLAFHPTEFDRIGKFHPSVRSLYAGKVFELIAVPIINDLEYDTPFLDLVLEREAITIDKRDGAHTVVPGEVVTIRDFINFMLIGFHARTAWNVEAPDTLRRLDDDSDGLRLKYWVPGYVFLRTSQAHYGVGIDIRQNREWARRAAAQVGRQCRNSCISRTLGNFILAAWSLMASTTRRRQHFKYVKVALRAVMDGFVNIATRQRVHGNPFIDEFVITSQFPSFVLYRMIPSLALRGGDKVRLDAEIPRGMDQKSKPWGPQ